MYFDGSSYYQFGESIDDYTMVYVDGVRYLSDAAWDNFGRCVVPVQTKGWHFVEFRLYNGGGGAGISGSATADNSVDKNGKPCGFGYGKSPTSTQPANMKALEWLGDTGDGSLLRPEVGATHVIELAGVEGFEVDETQYDVTISNMLGRAQSVELYYGGTPEVSVLTNSSNELVRRFTLDAGKSTTLQLEWESESGEPPYYVVVFPGVGVSDLQSFTAGSRVAASVKSVGSDSAVITAALGFDIDVTGDAPTASLTAYFGTADAGTADSAWELSKPLGTVEAGTYDYTIEGLELGKTYFVRIMAEDDGHNRVWSQAVTFSVSGVYLGGPVAVYENDPRTQRLSVLRTGSQADIAREQTVFLEYSGGGLGSVSAMPGSVTFAAGATSADVEFTTVDNSRTDGDRSFTASLMSGSSYVAIAPASCTVTVMDDESAEGEVVTWTGAKDLSWDDAANWDKGYVPRSVDTARFADAGVAAGMEVDIASAEGIRTLSIETPRAFAFVGQGSLAVNRVSRADTDGAEEGAVSIGVPVVAGNAENGFSLWSIAGSAGVELNAGLSAPEGIRMLKQGDGGLWLNSPDTAYAGPWSVYEGAVYAAAENAVRGSFTIGSSDIPARLEALADNAISPESSITVLTNGTLVAREPDDPDTPSMRVDVYEGGFADLGGHFSAHQAYLTGGRVEGEVFSRVASGQRIVSSASGLTSVFGGDYRICPGGSFDVSVEDGPAAVDLVIGGRVYCGEGDYSGNYFTKFGTGTLRTLSDWTGMSLGAEIAAGRVLVDNPSSDGLGSGAVKVDAGATLGGTGFLGSSVTVVGEGNNEGEIAPGTVDDGGNHVIGTLTVGAPAGGAGVSFADYTRFTAHIGAGGASDLLLVNGPVTIAQGAGSKIDIVCDDVPQAGGGTHVVLRATGGITGSFHSVTVPRPGWRVVYTANEILAVPPQPGRKVIIR